MKLSILAIAFLSPTIDARRVQEDILSSLEDMELPTAQNPCVVCPDGVTVADADLSSGADAVGMGDMVQDGMSCDMVVRFAAMVETGSEECTMMEASEALCCPKPVVTPCPFCPGGITVALDTPVGEDGDTTTCEELSNMFAAFEADSDLCKLTQADMAAEGDVNPCCPDDTSTSTSTPDVTEPATEPAPVADSTNSAFLVSGFS